MILSPEIAARYQSLNKTDHIRRKRQYPSARNVIIELAIFTDKYVKELWIQIILHGPLKVSSFREFHKFVRERFSEEPEDKKQNIISNIILVKVSYSYMSLSSSFMSIIRRSSILWSFIWITRALAKNCPLTSYRYLPQMTAWRRFRKYGET